MSIDSLTAFLDRAFTMPTTVFSVLLIGVALYWLVSLLTGVDWLGDLAEGAGGVAEGALDGALNGALDGTLNGALDGTLEGASEGALGSEVDLEQGRGRREEKGWLRLLGLGELPATLVLSLLVGFGWAFSYGGSALASKVALLAAGGVGAVLVIAFTAIALSVVATIVAVTPLRRLMKFIPATERQQLVGQHARVTTLRVDEGFGQAEVDDASGAPILIQARSLDLINTIGRGDIVRVVDYDPAREVFMVEASNTDAAF